MAKVRIRIGYKHSGMETAHYAYVVLEIVFRQCFLCPGSHMRRIKELNL